MQIRCTRELDAIFKSVAKNEANHTEIRGEIAPSGESPQYLRLHVASLPSRCELLECELLLLANDIFKKTYIQTI